MNPDIKEQIELYVLRRLYPNARDKHIAQLRELALRKGIAIVEIPEHEDCLDNLMCSIIRHRHTQYEQVVAAGVPRANARGLIQPILKQTLDRMKGQPS